MSQWRLSLRGQRGGEREEREANHRLRFAHFPTQHGPHIQSHRRQIRFEIEHSCVLLKEICNCISLCNFQYDNARGLVSRWGLHNVLLDTTFFTVSPSLNVYSCSLT